MKIIMISEGKDMANTLGNIPNLYAGWTPEQWQAYGATGGTITDGNKLQFGSLSEAQINAMQPASSAQLAFDTELLNANTTSPGFGMNMGTIGKGFDIASGLGRLYLGNEQLNLAKDKFAYDKDMMNKQYAMAKDSYDKQVARAGSIGSQMNAGKVG